MFFAGSQPIGTEACACLDTRQGLVRKKTECWGGLGRMLECGWCEQSAGSYGNLLRLTSFPQGRTEQCCAYRLRYLAKRADLGHT